MKPIIVINHYILNDEIHKLALDAIHSFQQTCDCIVLSIDDCSPYDMSEIEEESDIFIKTPHNMGFAGSANFGFKYVLEHFDGDVVYSNNDVIVNPGWYEEFCRIREILKADMVGGLGYRDKGHVLEPRPKYSEGGRLEDWMFPGGFYMTTTDILQEIGIYDENYKHGGVEDIDLFYRMKRAGKRLIITGKLTYWHKEGATRFSPTMKGINNAAEVENLKYFNKKWGFDAIKYLYSRILVDNRINL